MQIRRSQSRLYKVDGFGNNDVVVNVNVCRDVDLSRLEKITNQKIPP